MGRQPVAVRLPESPRGTVGTTAVAQTRRAAFAENTSRTSPSLAAEHLYPSSEATAARSRCPRFRSRVGGVAATVACPTPCTGWRTARRTCDGSRSPAASAEDNQRLNARSRPRPTPWPEPSTASAGRRSERGYLGESGDDVTEHGTAASPACTASRTCWPPNASGSVSGTVSRRPSSPPSSPPGVRGAS